MVIGVGNRLDMTVDQTLKLGTLEERSLGGKMAETSIYSEMCTQHESLYTSDLLLIK